MFGSKRRRALEERIELLRLDLARVEGASSLTNLLLATLIQQGHKLMAQLDDIIASLNANTNLVAARLDAVIAQITNATTSAQLSELQAISDHLKALGTDPAATASALGTAPAATAAAVAAQPAQPVTADVPPVAILSTSTTPSS